VFHFFDRNSSYLLLLWNYFGCKLLSLLFLNDFFLGCFFNKRLLISNVSSKLELLESILLEHVLVDLGFRFYYIVRYCGDSFLSLFKVVLEQTNSVRFPISTLSTTIALLFPTLYCHVWLSRTKNISHRRFICHFCCQALFFNFRFVLIFQQDQLVQL